MNGSIHSNEWEMLSAYLDGQMSESEQRRVRDLLVNSAELRAGLEELRRTRAVLRAAPRRRVPHNFTLTPAMAHKARPHFRWSWAPSLGFASALATVLLVLTFFVQLSPAGTPASSIPAATAQAAQSRAAIEQDTPPIIIWNDSGSGSAPRGLGSGMGSGPVTEPMKQATQTAPDTLAAPAAGTTAETQSPEATAVPPALALTAPADLGSRPPLVQPTVAAGLASKSAPQAAPNAGAPESSGPILGIAPTEERGKMVVPTLAHPDPYGVRASDAPVAPGFNWIQVALGAIALLTGLAALTIWWRSRI